MNSCGDGVLHPPAPVSVHGDRRERYTAYQYRESILVATKRMVNKDLRVFFWITLKFGKKTLRIGVPELVNAHPICPKFFK